MKKGLNKFVSTKDVLGAYILDPEGIVIESDMPPKYSEEILRQIGRDLSGISGLARSDFSDAEQISFFFENAVLCMQGLNEGHLFITLTGDIEVFQATRGTDIDIKHVDVGFRIPFANIRRMLH
jgi:predicted regulator of Ras-like GTPase activity (Roadblock/LC7/MglB family)